MTFIELTLHYADLLRLAERLREENEGLSARNADLEEEVEEGLLLYARDQAIAERNTLLTALREVVPYISNRLVRKGAELTIAKVEEASD